MVHYSRRRRIFPPHLLALTLFFIFSSFLGDVFVGANTAHAMDFSTVRQTVISSVCPKVGDPNSNSLLVVLLDRSGSLIATQGPTDPHLYSTSVTKALADLWPGRMAVVPFHLDVTVVPHFGPYTLSDPRQRKELRDQLDQTNSTIGSGTPLEAAMRAGLQLLQGAPSGSRVILITDGAPGNVAPGLSEQQQESDIRGGLIQQYCSEGFPISAFGLTINDPNANQLLDDITTGTGGTYQDVTDVKDLSRVVVQLYSDWQHLNFVEITGQGGNYPENLDSHVNQVTFVTFRSNDGYGVTLDDPNSQPVTGLQTSTDTHYVIDTLNEGVFNPGIYTVHVSDVNGSNDPDAHVYALVNSPLQVKITGPTVQQVYSGNPIEIDTTFLNGNGPLTPGKTATITAYVSLFVNGNQVGKTNTIDLIQQGQSDLFKGQTIAYNQAGQLHIKIVGNYQGDQRSDSADLVLVVPCQWWNVPCQLQNNTQQTEIILGVLGALLLLLIVLLILWLRRRRYIKPFGMLYNTFEKLDLDQEFRRSPVHSNDIANKGTFNFQNADFDLVFKRNGDIYIQTTKRNGSPIIVSSNGQRQPLDGAGARAALSSGSTITIGNQVAATYK